MSTHIKCPRCSNVIARPASGQPVCPVCNYPGADARTAAPTLSYPTDAGSPPAAFGQPKTGLTTAAFILGPTGLLFPLAGIAGIICAGMAKSRGQPKATAALIVAILGTIFGMALGAYVYARQQ